MIQRLAAANRCTDENLHLLAHGRFVAQVWPSPLVNAINGLMVRLGGRIEREHEVLVEPAGKAPRIVGAGRD